MDQPGIDYPEVDGEADVTVVGRGISVSSRVEYATEAIVVVRPSTGEYVEGSVVGPGDTVEVFWLFEQEGRALPAEVTIVEDATVPRWHLSVTGPAEHSQRRKAVRARVSVPLTARYAGATDLAGEALDLSENGLRALIDGWGLPPEPGMRIDLTLQFEQQPMELRGEILRQQSRGPRWLMSIKLVGLAEREEDRLRRHVFQALREEQARRAQ